MGGKMQTKKAPTVWSRTEIGAEEMLRKLSMCSHFLKRMQEKSQCKSS